MRVVPLASTSVPPPLTASVRPVFSTVPLRLSVPPAAPKSTTRLVSKVPPRYSPPPLTESVPVFTHGLPIATAEPAPTRTSPLLDPRWLESVPPLAASTVPWLVKLPVMERVFPLVSALIVPWLMIESVAKSVRMSPFWMPWMVMPGPIVSTAAVSAEFPPCTVNRFSLPMLPKTTSPAPPRVCVPRKTSSTLLPLLARVIFALASVSPLRTSSVEPGGMVRSAPSVTPSKVALLKFGIARLAPPVPFNIFASLSVPPLIVSVLFTWIV